MFFSIIINNIIPVNPDFSGSIPAFQHSSSDIPQILESREKKWILIGLLRSVPEKSSLNLTLYIQIALAHSMCLLIIPNVKTPKKT